MGVTTDDLLENIKRRSFAPISQNTLTDEDVLSIAYEELITYVAPKVLSTREDFFLRPYDTSITLNKSRYPIASRAMGNSLKSLWYLDSDGEHRYRIDRTDLSKRDYYPETGAPEAFYLEGDQIVLVPTPNRTEGTLRQYYFQKSSRFKKTEACAKITAATESMGTLTLTVDTDLTDSLSNGDTIDIVNGQSPFILWAFDQTISTISATTITLSSADLLDGASSLVVGVGDYVCPAGFTNIPLIPEEFHSVLAVKTALTIIGSGLGDVRKAQILMQDLQALEDGAMRTIGNRVTSNPKKVNPRNSIASGISGWRAWNRRSF